MAIDLFGFTIGRTQKNDNNVEEIPKEEQSFVSPDEYDGSYTYDTGSYFGGIFGSSVDFTGTARDENQMIAQYRNVALYPECDNAIEDICNDAIVMGSDRKPVKLDLDRIALSENIKNKIYDEFDNILRLMNFSNRAYEIFRRWYVDSKLFYHIVINTKDPQKGIIELRPIDPVKIKRIRKIVKSSTNTGIINKSIPMVEGIEEYFVYTDTDKDSQYNTSSSGIKITKDSIAYANSGLFDASSKRVVGYLQKAIRPVNMLRQIEDAVVVYRISRAPERRIFYIDVGNLPKQKAEQYLREISQKYRTKLIYDQSTGEIQDSRNHMSMLEDYWLPRREGGRGTEISTLSGGQNLGQMEDVEYLLRKVYNSLNIPITRMYPDSGFNMGRAAEITRDEVKFYKYIERLRTRFATIFIDILRVQCILKGVLTENDWNYIHQDIQFIFNRDSYFTELKENEILSNRLQMLGAVQPLIGSYFSDNYVKKNILRMDDQEIIQMNSEIRKEQEEIMAAQAAQAQEMGPPREEEVEEEEVEEEVKE